MTRPIETLIPAYVQIDDAQGGPYPALIADERWNGFACPSFDRETAEQIARDLNAYAAQPWDESTTLGDHGSARVTWDGPRLVIDDGQYAVADECEPDGNGRYWIGAWGWTWSVVAPPVGTRVRLRRDVDRYPHFVAPAGALGVVTRDDDSVWVTLDEPLAGAEEWDNAVLFSDDDELAADVEIVR